MLLPSPRCARRRALLRRRALAGDRNRWDVSRRPASSSAATSATFLPPLRRTTTTSRSLTTLSSVPARSSRNALNVVSTAMDVLRPIVAERSALLLSRTQQRFEVRRVRLAIDDRRLYIPEARGLQILLDLQFREAEPEVGVHLARLFEVMAIQVEHFDAAAGLENPVCLRDRFLG